MTAVAQVFAVLAAAVHVLIFTLESVLFTRPQVYRRFMVPSAQEAAVLRPMALNQGFYNLFLAIGAVVGVILMGDAGKALIFLACGSMVAAALVLLVTDRRMARAAASQGVLPLVAVVFLLLS